MGGPVTVTASSSPSLSRGLKNEEHPKPEIKRAKQHANHMLENVTTWFTRKKQKQRKAGRDERPHLPGSEPLRGREQGRRPRRRALSPRGDTGRVLPAARRCPGPSAARQASGSHFLPPCVCSPQTLREVLPRQVSGLGAEKAQPGWSVTAPLRSGCRRPPVMGPRFPLPMVCLQ